MNRPLLIGLSLLSASLFALAAPVFIPARHNVKRMVSTPEQVMERRARYDRYCELARRLYKGDRSVETEMARIAGTGGFFDRDYAIHFGRYLAETGRPEPARRMLQPVLHDGNALESEIRLYADLCLRAGDREELDWALAHTPGGGGAASDLAFAETERAAGHLDLAEHLARRAAGDPAVRERAEALIARIGRERKDLPKPEESRAKPRPNPKETS